jgi:hypothetical protein
VAATGTGPAETCRASSGDTRFGNRGTREGPLIAAEHPDETKLHALIRMEIACQLALESLPELPPETGERLRDPIRALCKVTRDELTRIEPSLAARFGSS